MATPYYTPTRSERNRLEAIASDVKQRALINETWCTEDWELLYRIVYIRSVAELKNEAEGADVTQQLLLDFHENPEKLYGFKHGGGEEFMRYITKCATNFSRSHREGIIKHQNITKKLILDNMEEVASCQFFDYQSPDDQILDQDKSSESKQLIFDFINNLSQEMLTTHEFLRRYLSYTYKDSSLVNMDNWYLLRTLYDKLAHSSEIPRGMPRHYVNYCDKETEAITMPTARKRLQRFRNHWHNRISCTNGIYCKFYTRGEM